MVTEKISASALTEKSRTKDRMDETLEKGAVEKHRKGA